MARCAPPTIRRPAERLIGEAALPISERELLNAMVASGRPVYFSTLAEWRRCGLLPAFASRSGGLRKGKLCFWPDDDTLDRAFLVHDLLQRDGERHNVFWLLWLSGMKLPLPYLRRAWRHMVSATGRQRARAPECGRQHVASQSRSVNLDAHGHLTPRLMLGAAFLACEVLGEDGDPELEALLEALDGFTAEPVSEATRNESEGLLRRHALRLLGVTLSALRRSELIVNASDEELLEAQKVAAGALRQLARSAPLPVRNSVLDWPVDAAQRFGTPLFLLILILQKSGNHALLNTISCRVSGNIDSRERPSRSIKDPDLHLA
jgi:hypothetical protein